MKTFDSEFTKPIIKYGRIGMLITAFLTFLPPLYLWVAEGVIPAGKDIFTAWVSVLSIFGVLYFIEPLSYYPVLGTAGTYLSYLSGNVGNVRIPALISAQKTLGVEPNTQKGDIISICAIVGSIITNTAMMILAAVIGNWLLSVLPAFVKSSFDMVLPAMAGAVLSNYVSKNKLGIGISLIIGLILSYMLTLGLKNAWATLLAVVLNIVINVVIYRNKKKKAQAA